MTAGRLAANKPAATTNTVLYRCPTTVTGSTVVNVCNQSGSAATYRVALRDYDQVLHLDGPESANGGLASSYRFIKGNPLSAYRVEVSPGYQFDAAIPGTQFTTTNGTSAKILDVYRPINDVTYYTIVEDVTTIPLAANSLAGQFLPGEVVTGSISGLTGVVRGGDDASIVLNMQDVSAGATSLQISSTTGLADGMTLTLAASDAGGEIATIDVGGIDTLTNTLTITRGELGTSAAIIRPGTAINAWSASATVTTISEGATYAGGDTTLTLTDSTGFVSGGFALIDNEIVEITDVNGNDLTVTRGRYGTADVDHNDGSTVTLLLDNGIFLVNFFSENEDITGAASNASATLSFPTTTQALIFTKYLVTETQGGTDHELIQTVPINLDRTYIYDLSDPSCSNYPLKFSADAAEGTNAAAGGTEYTQGVSKVGVAGTAGAFTSISVDTNTAINLFAYADGTPAGSTIGVGFTLNVDTNPTYTEIYLYDVAGETLIAGDTFTINNVTQTVQQNGITVGPFGYVQAWHPDKCHLKIALGAGSTPFTATTEIYDTPTLNLGYRTMTKVVDGKILSISNIGAADANRVVGVYENLTADSTSGSGNLDKALFTVTVTTGGVAAITIVDGGEDFTALDTIQINDGQLGNGGGAALVFTAASVSSGVHTDQDEIYSEEDYLFYGNQVAANETEKNSAIVVGPGQNILVYSSAADLSYIVNGFESVSDDFPVVNLTKIVTDDGGGAAPAP